MVFENNFSEKFVDDLKKFKIWLDENQYYLSDIATGENIKLEMDLINFSEPSRNKLECYVKELVKYYSLVKDNEEIDDIKSMVKDFRQNKSKKSIKKGNEKKKLVEKVEKKMKDKESDIKDKESDIKEEEVCIIKEKEDCIIRDIINIGMDSMRNIDTDNVCYIDTLEFSTKNLEGVFGKPLKNGKEGDKHQYEWKILVVTEKEEIIYSIYNWMDKNGNFKEYNKSEWNLGTMKRCLRDKSRGCECQLYFIIEFIKTKVNELNNNESKKSFKNNQKLQIEKEEIANLIEDGNKKKLQNENEEIKERSIMQLFNLTDTEPGIIDIDDICF